MTDIRIGITERGDGGLDYVTWERNLPSVDGAIIITKNLTHQGFRDAMLRNKDKLILHATITGYGQTPYEPFVPSYEENLDAMEELIRSGFPASHIVLRCDPIIPQTKLLEQTRNMLQQFLQRNLNVNRVRVSVIDNYPHVKERFGQLHLPALFNGYFQAGRWDMVHVAKMLDEVFAEHDEIRISSCAEPILSQAAQENRLRTIFAEGCVGETDLRLLNLPVPDNMHMNPQNRKGCLCLAGKTELLAGSRGRCPHGCAYCYWK